MGKTVCQEMSIIMQTLITYYVKKPIYVALCLITKPTYLAISHKTMHCQYFLIHFKRIITLKYIMCNVHVHYYHYSV